MVIVIHQTKSTENAFLYNEKKVEQKVASFFHSRNTKAINPFFYNKNHRLKEFTDIDKLNPRIKNKCLHISLNPSTEDCQKLNDKTIRVEIDEFMKYMGYKKQPYFVYKHKDLERVHFHIVSTRIDCQTGLKIKDSHERQKAQKFIHQFNCKYQIQQNKSKEDIAFKFSPHGRNLKQSLEHLFQFLNQLECINSKALYDEALKQFNVEIRKSGKGHVVVVTNDKEEPIRYPIRLSKFREKPHFLGQETKKLEVQTNKAILKSSHNSLLMDFVKELNWHLKYQDIKNQKGKKYKTRKKRYSKRL
ncbi:hypothetical protein DF185_04160 [Marinifilum breve]|uniref:MobA/VirD2-like nuclease domain-containing protein n=1 Tax=Marinifilum breve TaxID=2184082 RepID=A0A2V3ZZX8_9BACT|nr:relaxase/mobilization nuclease domain-containing protein [Marinifilum breve]PXY01851.1 hypothetical protein DF185_04160 [Marinifilum breve]